MLNGKVQSKLYIKVMEGNQKMCPLYTGSNYVNYSLNVENETALYTQWFVICRCILWQVCFTPKT